MDGYYYGQFCVLALACAVLEFRNVTQKDKVAMPTSFTSFRNNYLLVFSLMMAGDWLQGPYVYALYQHYGYSTGDIGKLFIAGFGSSMVFGTVVGSLADKHGRKKAGLLYCATYVASCLTKHSSDYYVLMLGRFFGGIATSLLFSAFESWLVSEHFKRGYEAAWLSTTFSKAIFLGNGVVSILCGLLANTLVDNFAMGPVAPFDAASVLLCVGAVVIAATWTENYGDASESTTLAQQFSTAVSTITSDRKVGLLGAMQSMFEAAMYTFVFLWTPALSPNGETIPHGTIFATFMVSSMIGSSIASRLMTNPNVRVEVYMQVVFAVSAAALAVPILVNASAMGMAKAADGGITFAGRVQLTAFLAFEVCVGIFWPSIMKMRASYVPEEVRSTIMNFFRIPLNLFVCVVLYNVSSFSIDVMFGMCCIFLGIACVCQNKLAKITSTTVYAVLPTS
eukprot:CAMPEP_0183799658 /NCGR_PEP_ID=MMETSP0803_2-20130417/22369_1 /TAXON_ID=195967 /ORGANISM="Crustomastix stigmata, Strain CCMP3273" /LENGTH=450 /DNA_ID=CAMNT_0026044363 /DNA_START=30 /DNA_END=1379 /DNA_ORIENTATION=-